MHVGELGLPFGQHLRVSLVEFLQIARGELSAICRAVGVMQPKDSCELHNLPLVVTVKCKKREDTGEVVNEVKGYSKKEQPAGQPQQAASDVPPWRRS